MFYLAKTLEAAGMAISAIGLFMGMQDPSKVTTELKLLVVGAVVFMIGRAIESRSGGEG